MSLDGLIANQLLVAQAIFALAEHVDQATGSFLQPVPFAELPGPEAGMVACIADSTVNTWGSVIAGGGTFTVLGFYNGAAWTVLAA